MANKSKHSYDSFLDKEVILESGLDLYVGTVRSVKRGEVTLENVRPYIGMHFQQLFNPKDLRRFRDYMANIEDNNISLALSDDSISVIGLYEKVKEMYDALSE